MSDFWMLFIVAVICIIIAYGLGYQMGFGKGRKDKYYQLLLERADKYYLITYEKADKDWILKFKPDPYIDRYTLELTTYDWNRANNEYTYWCKRLQEVKTNESN